MFLFVFVVVGVGGDYWLQLLVLAFHVYCLLLLVYCFLLVGCCLMFVVCCLLVFGCWLMLVGSWLWLLLLLLMLGGGGGGGGGGVGGGGGGGGGGGAPPLCFSGHNFRLIGATWNLQCCGASCVARRLEPLLQHGQKTL